MAAIAMALLSVGVAGATLVNFMLTRSKEAQVQALGQAQLLTWADKAVRDFALTNGRLPCPANVKNGPEICADASINWAKGWLPVASLVEANPLPGIGQTPDELINVGIAYLVYQGADGRGSATDITATTSAFLPRLENGKPLSGYPGNMEPPPAPPPDGPPIKSTMDLCAKLVMAGGGWQIYPEIVMVDGEPTPLPVPRRWRIAADASAQGPTAPVMAREMVYGVAVAAHGAPREASGSNASFDSAQLESPLRIRDAEYKDLVKITRPAELYDAFNCAGAIASLDTMAVAHAWSGVNEGNRRGVIKFAERVIKLTEIALAADTVGLAIQVAEEANALWNAGGNAVKLLQAKASIFLWPFVPVHVAGGAQAVAGGALTAIDLGISTAAIVVDAKYMQGYAEARDRLDQFTVWTGGQRMLEDAHHLGVSTIMVPNPIILGPPQPVVPPDVGTPK